MSDTANRPAAIKACVVLAGKILGELLPHGLPDGDDCPTISVAVDPDGALEELSRSPYDVLVTNFHLNGVRNSGLQLLSRAIVAHRGLRGIVLGQSGDRDDVLASFRAGARGYLVESDCSVATLLKAIRCIHEGQVWASSRHLNFILDEFAAHKKQSQASPHFNDVLSSREWEVAQLIIRGKSNKEIAAALHVSQHTVKNHIVKIFVKLGVTSRSAAVFHIYKHSLIRASSSADDPIETNEAGNSVSENDPDGIMLQNRNGHK